MTPPRFISQVPRNLNFFLKNRNPRGGRGRGAGHFDWRWRALILEKIWLTIGGRRGKQGRRGGGAEGVGTGSLKKRLLSSRERSWARVGAVRLLPDIQKGDRHAQAAKCRLSPKKERKSERASARERARGTARESPEAEHIAARGGDGLGTRRSSHFPAHEELPFSLLSLINLFPPARVRGFSPFAQPFPPSGKRKEAARKQQPPPPPP